MRRGQQCLSQLLQTRRLFAGLTKDAETPKGQQKHFKGVYVMSNLGQTPAAPQKSRFAAREQVPGSHHRMLAVLEMCFVMHASELLCTLPALWSGHCVDHFPAEL